MMLFEFLTLASVVSADETELAEYIRKDLHAEALEAAEQRGYARGIDAAAFKIDESDVPTRAYLSAAIRALSPTPPAPVVPRVKPLVFEWAHQPTENPSEHITIGNGYSARVYIPYKDGNDPASGVGTWCGVAQQRGQSGFSSKEAAVAYCEETIRDYAQAAVNGASNFIDMSTMTLQEAARVLRDAPELMEGWSDDGWADICALAEQEER